MEDEDMEKKVKEYLHRKGLRVAELAPQGDRSRHPASAPPGVPLHSMPGGFLHFPPNGHAYFAPPWPPQPLPVSMAQHAALASKGNHVININDSDDVRIEKRLTWKPDEDLRLVRAWLDHSNDLASGNVKKNDQYWRDVLASYNSTTSERRKRKVKHLKDRFQKIKRSVGFFCWSLKKAASTDDSEQSDDQLIEKALQFYLDDYKEGPFVIMHCWKALRDEPKWHAVLEDLDEKSNKRKLGDEGEVGNNTPTSEDTREMEQPTVVKEAKRQCNGKGKVKANDNGLDEDIKKYLEIQAGAKRRHDEFIKVQLRVSDAKVEAARLKREAAMLKTYNSFMGMNTRVMTDEVRTEHAIGLKLLRERLFGSNN
ncbi:hypothetical protein HU200_042850 [Digitaria exilis]|uniref:No apical meristem-associated C-terminal domain-containing protein n=1 Tax=Digitaria exilis TaxID=1010633 RepID=A0A835B4L1_9POAL|nr:hypothetical protein HU200_042850 [Digitaria exilis]CAB3471005.1 unnamed protein product [Digitaria exilis]